jgi:hypothetical protein
MPNPNGATTKNTVPIAKPLSMDFTANLLTGVNALPVCQFLAGDQK